MNFTSAILAGVVVAACGERSATPPAPTSLTPARAADPPPAATVPKPPPPAGDTDGATELANVPDQTPFALAVSNGFVYWSDRVGGGVWRVPTAGGKPQRLASGLDQPRWIVPAFGKLFVSTEDHTISIPETGGAPRVVAPERDTLALGSDGVYIANDLGRLIRVDAQGVVTEVADHLAQPLTMAVVGTTVIWTATDHGIWKLMRGQKPIRLAILPTESVILAVHGEQAYVEAFDGQDLMAVPVGGGKSSAVLPALGETSSLTVDADGIWWTSMITNSVSGSSISHPTPHVMFDHQARATGIVTDRDALYWFTWQLGVPGHGRIMRAKKPSFARASSDQ